MGPKKNAREATPAAAATTTASPAASTSAKSSAAKGGAANWDVVIENIYNHYIKETPQRTKLIDAFLFFLVVVGALQFAYCVLAGNYVRWKSGRRKHELCHANTLSSHSTLSFPVSLLQSVNSFSQVHLGLSNYHRVPF